MLVACNSDYLQCKVNYARIKVTQDGNIVDLITQDGNLVDFTGVYGTWLHLAIEIYYLVSPQ